VADSGNFVIRKITPDGVVSTLAGLAGSRGSADGTGSAARFGFADGLVADSANNVYVSDTTNHTIRKISPGGVVTTIAGAAGIAGSSEGSGSNARFNGPIGIAVDRSGNLYVADSDNHTIRKIALGGSVTTLAGLAGNRGSADGTGSAASFSNPWGLVLDPQGNIVVTDSRNGTIRKATIAGVVTTFAGSNGGSVDGVGTNAKFNFPYGLAIDGSGDLYVAENAGATIRKVTSAANVTTLAGQANSHGFLDGVGAAARFNYPIGIVATPGGIFYVADSANHAIRIGASATAPVIQGQSQSRVITFGASLTLSVTAVSNTPLAYRWQFNGADLAGETGASFAIGFGQYSSAGSYTVVVSNVAGSVVSTPIIITLPSPESNLPAIAVHPQSQTVDAGASVTLSINVISGTPMSYQWRKDGIPILGATNATLTLGGVQSGDAAAYTVVVTNVAGSSTSSAALLSMNLPGRLINLSVLTDIATPGDGFTLGYVVGGNSTLGVKPLVIRAAGPSLGALGVPGTLDDPKLELVAGSAKTVNDNWGGSSQISAAFAAVGAFAYTGPLSKDAAITASVTTRDNSVAVSAVGSGTGKVIAEIYDATPNDSFTTATPRLINVSVRKHLGPGLTIGFVLGGSTLTKVLVRGIGPTLGAFGVPDTVVDPQLTLFNSASVKIGENNDWAGAAELSAAFAGVGAFALPATSKDAALLVTLPPGNYSAQVTGANGTTGVALVEVYEVP
jgi:sugar lactone lactonase YvrE